MPVRFLDRLFKRSAPGTKETFDDGQSPSASTAHRTALAPAPDDWQSLKAIAESVLRRGELALAIELFDDLIGRGPADPELYYKRANVRSAAFMSDSKRDCPRGHLRAAVNAS